MKKQLISVLTAAAMLTGMSALTAQAASPRLVPYREVMNAFSARVSQGFDKFVEEEDNASYGVLMDDNAGMFSYLWYRFPINPTLETAGFCFLDLNDDGTEELLLGTQNSDQSWQMMELYTLSGGKVHHLLSQGERDWFAVLRSGKIMEEGSNGAAESVTNFYTIGSERLLPEYFYKQNPDGYFMNDAISLKTSDSYEYYEADETSWQNLTQSEYMAQTEGLTAALPMVPLSEYSDEMFLSTRATLGDLNDDGAIDAGDAADVLIASARAGATGSDDLTDDQFFAADTDSDGLVNAGDAANILVYSAYAGAGGDMTFYMFLTQKQ